MYYSTRRGYINVILLIIILLALLVFVAWMAYNTGVNVSEGRSSENARPDAVLGGIEAPLTSISLAENANLHKATGIGKIDKDAGLAELDFLLPEGVSLPSGTVLSGWLVDAGNLGGLGESSVSQLDQQYGTPFANVTFSKNVDDAPYALSLGSLVWDFTRGSFHLFYETNDSLGPYDAFMITLESDGNQKNYDPRPGTPVMIGKIE